MADSGANDSLLGKIAGYTEILIKDPHSTVFVPLSEAYRSMGLLDEAIDVARRGNAAVPGYAPGFITLGRSLAEQGRLDEADAAFAQALQLEDVNLQALKGLARIKMLRGLPEQARPLLLKARQQAPEDTSIAKMLASLGPQQQTSPLVPPSAPTAEPTPGKSDVPIATVTVAEIYERQGLYRKAYKVYYDLYQAEPANQGLRRKLGELKRLIESGGETTAAAAPIPTPAATPAPPVTKPVDPLQPLIDVYHRWLEVIQSRRPHV